MNGPLSSRPAVVSASAIIRLSSVSAFSSESEENLKVYFLCDPCQRTTLRPYPCSSLKCIY